MLISACAMRELSHRLAHVGRPEVVRDLVDQRRHHLFTRIAAAHRAAHATLGGDVHGAHLPASPARVAPDARAARGFKEARGEVATDLRAHPAFEPGDVAHLDVRARLRICELAREHGVDAVLRADLAQRRSIELLGADGGEELLAITELYETRARLRRLHLFLELPRGARAEGLLGVGAEIDDTDGTVPLEVHLRRHRNDDGP